MSCSRPDSDEGSAPLGERCDQRGIFLEPPRIAQHRERLLHADHGALQRGVRVQHEAIAHAAEVLGAEDGRLAADHHVHELRPVEALRQGADLLGAGDRLDEQDVGAGLGELLCALDRGFEAQHGELENLVERLLACHGYLAPEGRLDRARLLEVFAECTQARPAPARNRLLKGARTAAERQRVREVLQSVQGDQDQACAILGISRSTLWRRLRDEAPKA